MNFHACMKFSTAVGIFAHARNSLLPIFSPKRLCFAFSLFCPCYNTINMGILVFHFIARLYIAILYIVDLTDDGIEENTDDLFLLSVVALFFSHFLSLS